MSILEGPVSKFIKDFYGLPYSMVLIFDHLPRQEYNSLKTYFWNFMSLDRYIM
jgi:hypothetical protein